MEFLSNDDIAEISALSPHGVERDVDLSSLSHWRIGGKADLIVSPATLGELAAVRRYFYLRNLPHTVMGLTSNLLFADEGLRVPCIRIGKRMAGLSISGADVYAGGGLWVPELAFRAMRASLTGAEHICGIPGTLGGLICMNGGSQRKGIGNSLVSVDSVDVTGTVRRRAGTDCDFGYRRSIFQSNGEVIASAHLRFEGGDRASVGAAMREILADRRRKFPRKEPNCGSVFKSDPAMYDRIGPPGVAIERLGLKGMQHGGAQVSPRHANFIVNRGGARASDVLTLVTRISDQVFDATGFRMAAEACYVTSEGRMLPLDQVARPVQAI